MEIKLKLQLLLKLNSILSWAFNARNNETTWKYWKQDKKDTNGENVAHVEITEVVLVHWNIFGNDYQQDSRVLYTFLSNTPCGSLFEVWPTNFIFLRTFTSIFQEIEVCFKDQNSQWLEIENRI